MAGPRPGRLMRGEEGFPHALTGGAMNRADSDDAAADVPAAHPAAAGPPPAEEPLDRDAGGAPRPLAPRMVDDGRAPLRTPRARPAWRPVPADHKRRFAAAPPPDEPQGL